MKENKVYIKWVNINTRRQSDEEEGNEQEWTASFCVLIENRLKEKVPVQGQIELSGENGNFIMSKENMVLNQQDVSQFNIHETVFQPVEWSTENPQYYKVTVTLRNAVGKVLDTYQTVMGFVKEEPFVNQREPIVYYQEPEATIYDDVMAMKKLNIQKIYYCGQDKKEEIYNLCDQYGIRVIDILPYTEIQPQSIYEIESYYGKYWNHPCIESTCVSPKMTQANYYLAKEIALKQRIHICTYQDENTIVWKRGFRRSKAYEASGLPHISEEQWIYNSLNQKKPMGRVIKKENQRMNFEWFKEEQVIKVINTYMEQPLEEILIGYEILEDGISIHKNFDENFEIQPGKTQEIAVDLLAIDMNIYCQYDLTVFSVLGQDAAYEKAGYILAMEQFSLQETKKTMEISPQETPMDIQKKQRKLFLEGKRQRCNIQRNTGELLNFAFQKGEFLLKPLEISYYIGEEGVAHDIQFKKYSLYERDNETEVMCEYKAKGYKGRITLCYVLNGEREFLLRVKVPQTIPLQKVCMHFRVNNSGDEISYFGKGPENNVKPYDLGAYLGVFDVDSMEVDMEREDVRWLIIGNYEFEIDPLTQCYCRIKKDANQFTDIMFELAGEQVSIKVEG